MPDQVARVYCSVSRENVQSVRAVRSHRPCLVAESGVRLPGRRRLPLERGSWITWDADGRQDARRINRGKARTEVQVWPDLLIAIDYQEAGADLVTAFVLGI